MCASHAYRRRRYGSPVGGGTFHGQPVAFLEGLLGTDSEDCIFWPFGEGAGYASVRYKGRLRKGHNIMCEMAHGPAPTSKHVSAHSCGNGKVGCVNPNHVRWATAAENVFDKISHGRLGGRLTAGQVKSIRRLHATMTATAIAQRFKVSRQCVSDIIGRRRWQWLSD